MSSNDYFDGMMAALDDTVDSRRMEYRSDYAAGVQGVEDIKAKLRSGEYKPSDVRFALNPGVRGGGDIPPWDGKAYNAGQQAARDRCPYDLSQKVEWHTGYSNRLLYEAFEAEDTGAAQITDECLGEEERD